MHNQHVASTAVDWVITERSLRSRPSLVKCVQSIAAIQASVSLTALDQKDPKAEQRAQIADAFRLHYGILPQRCVEGAFKLASGFAFATSAPKHNAPMPGRDQNAKSKPSSHPSAEQDSKTPKAPN